MTTTLQMWVEAKKELSRYKQIESDLRGAVYNTYVPNGFTGGSTVGSSTKTVDGMKLTFSTRSTFKDVSYLDNISAIRKVAMKHNLQVASLIADSEANAKATPFKLMLSVNATAFKELNDDLKKDLIDSGVVVEFIGQPSISIKD